MRTVGRVSEELVWAAHPQKEKNARKEEQEVEEDWKKRGMQNRGVGDGSPPEPTLCIARAQRCRQAHRPERKRKAMMRVMVQSIAWL